MEVEIWKDLPNFEEFYKVSSLGRIFSIKSNKVRSLFIDKKGRVNITLYKGSVGITKGFPRLVASAFLDNYSNNLEVNHIDGNPANNRIDNLEMNTRSENELHAHRTGLKKGYWLGKRGASHTMAKSITCKDLNGNIIKQYLCAVEAEKEGFIRSGISAVCNGTRKSHKGFIWEFN